MIVRQARRAKYRTDPALALMAARHAIGESTWVGYEALGGCGWVDSKESEGFARRDLPLSTAGGGSEVRGTYTFGGQTPLSFNVR